jgi:hypothetical protein
MMRILLLVLFLAPCLCWSEDLSSYTARLSIGEWEPNTNDIVSALDLIKQDVWNNKFRQFRDYRFQYYGIKKEGKKVVVINAFCVTYWEHAKDWRTALVMVMDGGACFFQAEYDVTDGKITSVRSNGEA